MKKYFIFQDKPWVYAHLLEIQRRVGKENFPLIEQAFYPTHIEMVSSRVFREELIFILESYYIEFSTIYSFIYIRNNIIANSDEPIIANCLAPQHKPLDMINLLNVCFLFIFVLMMQYYK